MTNKNNRSKQKAAEPRKELLLFEPKTLFLIIATSVITLAIAFFGEQGTKFFTSVLSPIPAHAPFDGTVYPVQNVPNWVKLTDAERKASYSALPSSKLISIPTYNPTRLAVSTDKLLWNDPSDDAIRNEKITYSVPYLGSYEFNGLENDGSHPAVDIKVPDGTPIYAIANGTVIKAQISNDGFGNHIVIQHNNFPSLADKNTLTTVYSSYSHLSSVSAKVNDVVTKGQLIGYSGMTGTATTPHLHFQIDNELASFHPYWPFNSADMRSAGYSFFDAINNGLKQDNAITYTINPMKYVQRYMGEQSVTVAGSTTSSGTSTSASSDPYDSLSFTVQVVDGANLKAGNDVKFVIQAFDAQGSLISNPNFKDQIQLSTVNSIGKLNRNTLDAVNLRTGATNIVKELDARTGTDRLVLHFRNKEFPSPEFTVLPADAAVTTSTTTTDTKPVIEEPPVPVIQPISSVKVPAYGFLVKLNKTRAKVGETITITVQPTDVRAVLLTSRFTIFSNPVLAINGGIGSFSKTSLEVSDFSNNQATVMFTADAAGEARPTLMYNNQFFYGDIITVGSTNVTDTSSASVLSASTDGTATTTSTEIPVEEEVPVREEPVVSPFSDVTKDSPYFEALVSLKSEGLVAGYGDGTFQPAKSVSRAESIAFVLKAIKQEPRTNITAIFPDVPKTAWYANYVTTAYDMEFVKGYPDGTFRPEDTVSMAEFFTMLFVAEKIDVDPEVVITLPQGVDPAAWYTPYLQEAIRKNLLVVAEVEIIDPAQPLTRGDIAQFIYRLRSWEKEHS